MTVCSGEWKARQRWQEKSNAQITSTIAAAVEINGQDWRMTGHLIQTFTAVLFSQTTKNRCDECNNPWFTRKNNKNMKIPLWNVLNDFKNVLGGFIYNYGLVQNITFKFINTHYACILKLCVGLANTMLIFVLLNFAY